MSDIVVITVKILASIAALYMCLSPSMAMYRIHKKRNTGVASIVPLVALWWCNHMWFLYGYLLDDMFPLMTTYFVGDITSVAFIAVYYQWSATKQYTRKMVVATLVVNSVATVYAVMGKQGIVSQSLTGVAAVVGYIAVMSSIVLYASPFATISHVIRTKSSASIPLVMVLIGTVNNVLWAAYGLLVSDALMVIPTSISITIGVVQIILYYVYKPRNHKSINIAMIPIDTITDAVRVVPLLIPLTTASLSATPVELVAPAEFGYVAPEMSVTPDMKINPELTAAPDIVTDPEIDNFTSKDVMPEENITPDTKFIPEASAATELDSPSGANTVIDIDAAKIIDDNQDVTRPPTVTSDEPSTTSIEPGFCSTTIPATTGHVIPTTTISEEFLLASTHADTSYSDVVVSC